MFLENSHFDEEVGDEEVEDGETIEEEGDDEGMMG